MCCSSQTVITVGTMNSIIIQYLVLFPLTVGNLHASVKHNIRRFACICTTQNTPQSIEVDDYSNNSLSICGLLQIKHVWHSCALIKDDYVPHCTVVYRIGYVPMKLEVLRTLAGESFFPHLTLVDLDINNNSIKTPWPSRGISKKSICSLL